ncbi:RcnB family protein, partial [Phenylobacterium sp.]
DGYRYDGYRADRYDRHRPPPRPPRYDPRWYPPVWTPSYRYRGGPWVPPPGFAPRRWSHGEVLPWTWWTPRHRIESWWSYGLPVPPLGFSWVRLGRDAVLVDLWTGRIVQVAYTLFW